MRGRTDRADGSGQEGDAAAIAYERDASLSMERAAELAVWLLAPILLLGIGPYLLIWGSGSLWAGIRTVFTPWYFVPGLLITVVLHEGLHALGFLLFGRARWRALHFGIDRATFSPYAGCREPLRAWAYRGAVLLPALVLGMVPLFLGWKHGVGWLAVLGTLQLVAAAGDLVVLGAVRGVPAGSLVLDHPERVGCRVVRG